MLLVSYRLCEMSAGIGKDIAPLEGAMGHWSLIVPIWRPKTFAHEEEGENGGKGA